MAKKYIMFIVLLFTCSFMLMACSEDNENADNNPNNQENNEDNNNDAENNNTQNENQEPEDIQFGDKTNLDEGESLESILDFLSDIQLPDVVPEYADDWNYLFMRENFGETNPTFYLSLTYQAESTSDISDTMHIYVSNSEDKIDFGDFDEKEEKTLSNDVEVSLGLFEDDLVTATMERDGVYYRFESLSDDLDDVGDQFIDMMEDMEKENELHDTINEELHQVFDESFIMPDYFATNVDLHSITTGEDGISFSYTANVTTEEGEDVSPRINYYVSSTSDPAEEIEEDEPETTVELPNGNEATMIMGKDMEDLNRDNENELYMSVNDFHVRIHALDIERPLDNEEADELMNIAGSIENE